MNIAGKAVPSERNRLVIMHKTDIQKLFNMPGGGGYIHNLVYSV